LPGATFVSLSAQLELPFLLSRLLPVDHYSRKNLVYLLAMQMGAACVYETDDDNIPGPNWEPRTLRAKVEVAKRTGWMNVYRLYWIGIREGLPDAS
jgi:hypothetical protein